MPGSYLQRQFFMTVLEIRGRNWSKFRAKVTIREAFSGTGNPEHVCAKTKEPRRRR